MRIDCLTHHPAIGNHLTLLNPIIYFNNSSHFSDVGVKCSCAIVMFNHDKVRMNADPIEGFFYLNYDTGSRS